MAKEIKEEKRYKITELDKTKEERKTENRIVNNAAILTAFLAVGGVCGISYASTMPHDEILKILPYFISGAGELAAMPFVLKSMMVHICKRTNLDNEIEKLERYLDTKEEEKSL